jgi:hypothetical protein
LLSFTDMSWRRDLPFLRSPRQDISVKESKREIFLSSDLHAKTYQ